MHPLEKTLFTEICKIRIIDPHTHVNPLSPTSKHLDDLLGYHYYTELAHSTGMDKGPLAKGTPPAERIDAIAEYLPRIENTVQYSWLLEIARDLFGFKDDHIDDNNVADLAAMAEKHLAQPDWEDQVFDRGNIDVVFLTNDFDDPLAGFNTELYVPCLRTDELVFKLGQPAVRDRLNKIAGVQVGNAAGLEQAFAAVFDHFTAHGAKACAIGLPPEFAPRAQTRQEVDPLLRRIAAGQPLSAEESAVVSRFAFWTIAGLCGEYSLPFDLMIGAVRTIYPGGVYQGQDLFDGLTTLCQYRDLFNAMPSVKFPVSVVNSSQNPELVAFSWIFPNVFPSGHWWYANIPALIDRDLRQRLQAVPRAKQIGYYSDAYKLEFCLPKFNMYRRVLARVLAEEFVHDRGWSEEKAISLATDVLRRNIERIFYGQEY